MSKSVINEREYVNLINQKMREHSEFEEGMSIELYPDSKEKPSGYKVNGPINARGIVSWATAKIDNQYTLKC